MSRMFSLRLGESPNCHAIFIENENDYSLTIFKQAEYDEYYYQPPTSISLKGASVISKLNDFLIELDSKLDYFNRSVSFDSAPTKLLNRYEPYIIVNINDGKLIIIESDVCTENYYKPAKEIILTQELVKKLYKLTRMICGVPIHLKPKEQTDNREANIETKKPSGWELLR
ncbi:hypothetical protein [Thermaerobacillus caldiproteolyticus]|uniref:hypothetical protein n=1 Tax=Thermaerobacillus caldiproteolyticus TaxID=247480 RepID=UPI0018F24B23|nr:hypothetical protein [Anoxybacillus caldiproteolyticus]